MFETTKAREEVASLAKTNPTEALRAARKIADPWFAAQAFAWVARFAPPEIASVAIREACETAKAGRDAYQRSAVLAWPLRAAIETENVKAAKAIVSDAIALLPKVRPSPSRAEAAGLLFEAAFPGGELLWRPLLAAIETHAPPDNDWKAGRTYRTLSHILGDVDKAAANRLVAVLPPGKTKDRAEKELAEGLIAPPRPFFW